MKGEARARGNSCRSLCLTLKMESSSWLYSLKPVGHTGIKLVYIEDLGSTVYSASFWTLLIVASSSDIGLILFWT